MNGKHCVFRRSFAFLPPSTCHGSATIQILDRLKHTPKPVLLKFSRFECILERKIRCLRPRLIYFNFYWLVSFLILIYLIGDFGFWKKSVALREECAQFLDEGGRSTKFKKRTFKERRNSFGERLKEPNLKREKVNFAGNLKAFFVYQLILWIFDCLQKSLYPKVEILNYFSVFENKSSLDFFLKIFKILTIFGANTLLTHI